MALTSVRLPVTECKNHQKLVSGGLGSGRTTLILLLLILTACARPSVDPAVVSATTGEQVLVEPATPESDPVEMIVRPTIGLATPWAVEGGAGYVPPTPVPTPVPSEPIVLLGPPLESTFRATDEIVFYWTWPLALTDEQRFVVYLIGGGRQIEIGRLEETNLGLGYHLRMTAGDLIDEPGPYGWQVVLEDSATGATLILSDIRLITIIDG